MLERVDNIGTEISHIGNMARCERHAIDFCRRSEQGVHS